MEQAKLLVVGDVSQVQFLPSKYVLPVPLMAMTSPLPKPWVADVVPINTVLEPLAVVVELVVPVQVVDLPGAEHAVDTEYVKVFESTRVIV